MSRFEVDDAETFFGRTAEVSACVERLQATSLLVVTGASGPGKSSLVRAGLVPALQRLGRVVRLIVPAHEADTAMTAALNDAVAPPALVIDQFEEVFTIGRPTL